MSSLTPEAQTILTALQVSNTIETLVALPLPSLVLKVMTEIEQKYSTSEGKINKLDVALDVMQHVLPASDAQMVRELIISFVQISKNPQLIQTINLVKQAAERIEDEISSAVDKPPKQCCVIS